MNTVYVSVADGTYTYKIDIDNKTYKLVIDDGTELEAIPKNTKWLDVEPEIFSIKAALEEAGLTGFKEAKSDFQKALEADIPIMEYYETKYDTGPDDSDRYEYETQNMLADDGQPDFQKEIEDLEGPELPAEE